MLHTSSTQDWDWHEISRRAPFADVPQWEWTESSVNPHLTIGILFANLDRPWDWRAVTKNPGILTEEMKLCTGLPWDKDTLDARMNVYSAPTWEERASDAVKKAYFDVPEGKVFDTTPPDVAHHLQ